MTTLAVTDDTESAPTARCLLVTLSQGLSVQGEVICDRNQIKFISLFDLFCHTFPVVLKESIRVTRKTFGDSHGRMTRHVSRNEETADEQTRTADKAINSNTNAENENEFAT